MILSPDNHQDLQSILCANADDIFRDSENRSMRRVFWDQQMKAIKTKNPRQIRWHPLIIKLCLHLKFKSPAAYHSLRQSGVLVLPSERTLFDYTHWYKQESGFMDVVSEQLLKEANVKEKRDSFVVLFDEMKIRGKSRFRQEHPQSLRLH